MVLKARNIVGIVRRYGTEELSSIIVLLNEDSVFSFDCEKKTWRPWNSDSYWDLYESETMLSVMRDFSPEQAVQILEEEKAFCQA